MVEGDKVKMLRKAGLASALALAALAVVSVASATATPTALCKNNTNSPYCKTEDRYASKTAIAASTTSLEIKAGIPPISIPCSESAITGETTAQSGEPMSLSIASFSIGKCTYAGKECTVTVTSIPPYSSSLAWTDHGNGSLAVGAEGGKPAWKIVCGTNMNCTFELASSLQLKGGVPGNIVASGASLKKQKGTICPPSTVVNATYSVTSPASLYVARAESPPAETTGLCKVSENYCEPGNGYSSGAWLEGSSTNIKFDMVAGYALGDMTCKSGSASAETLAAYGQPLPLRNESFLFNECGFSGAPESCEVLKEVSYTGSVSRSGKDGLWKGGGLKILMNCQTASLVCTFTVPSESTIKIVHGEPGAIKLEEVPLTVSGSPICPKSATLVAEYKLTGPLFVTDVTR